MRWIVLKTIGNLFLEIVIYSEEGIHQNHSVCFKFYFLCIVFNSVIYRYNYGTLISSPYLSSVIADLVMRKLEVGALSLIRLPFYSRFVNDILLAAPASSVSSIVDIFNSQHPRLQITMEVWWYDRIFWMLQ